MPSNYVLLNKQTLTASAASVTFSSIPQTGYTDLKVVISARSDRSFTNDSLGLKPNNSTSNRSGRTLQGSGSAASSTTTTGEIVYAALNGNTATANTFSNIEIYCPNYTSGNYKSFSADGVMETNASGSDLSINAWLWSDVSPITSLVFYPIVGSNFVANSEFSLYGIAAVGTTPSVAPFATGGDIVTNDGTYWYHAFLSSGTFTPAKALTANCLVVAGGAGGGWAGGGGGAGGLLHYSAQSLTSGVSQTVIVGAGGAAGVTATKTGANGSNSVFGSLTASVGGGGGAGYDVSNGLSGGSGGGGNNINGSLTIGSGGTGTSGQGNNGGASGNTNNTGYGTGGGGGAGAGGGAGTNSAGGNGGVGINTYSSYASATGTGANSGYYAGGGGGGVINNGFTAGTGGLGGGGAGKNSAGAAPSGTANTGGGGGAGFNGGPGVNDGGAGGSGIVIVRYPMA
jgi:hypothetical protein